jgi:hypothetical protein
LYVTESPLAQSFVAPTSSVRNPSPLLSITGSPAAPSPTTVLPAAAPAAVISVMADVVATLVLKSSSVTVITTLFALILCELLTALAVLTSLIVT